MDRSGYVLCWQFVLVNRLANEKATRAVERPRHTTSKSPFQRLASGVTVMAKGQVKSNKEVRKPKAEKPKPAVSVGTSPFTQPPGKK